jgi:hypothetical protein
VLDVVKVQKNTERKSLSASMMGGREAEGSRVALNSGGFFHPVAVHVSMPQCNLPERPPCIWPLTGGLQQCSGWLLSQRGASSTAR